MKTNGETDPNHKVLEGLYTSLGEMDKNINAQISSILNIDTSNMPPETREKFKSLQSQLPNIVEQMKQSANPVVVAQNFANQWR